MTTGLVILTGNGAWLLNGGNDTTGITVSESNSKPASLQWQALQLCRR